MTLDFFEIERVIEDLAKAYPAQCTTTWFKIIRNHRPTVEQYRNKVVEYMKQFKYLLETYPQNPETDKLKEIVNKALDDEIEKVLQGNNSWGRKTIQTLCRQFSIRRFKKYHGGICCRKMLWQHCIY